MWLHFSSKRNVPKRSLRALREFGPIERPAPITTHDTLFASLSDHLTLKRTSALQNAKNWMNRATTPLPLGLNAVIMIQQPM